MKKRYFLLLLFPIFAQLFTLFFLHFDEKIRVEDFKHGFKETYSVDVSGLDFEQLDAIFMQPFTYLGHGKQMVAFESSDKKHVLKLFNPMRPLKKKWFTKWKYWKRYNSLKWIKREWFQKEKRLQKLFERHQLAFEKIRLETGLEFVHLKPSKRVCHLVHLTDNRGRKQIVSLADTPFVLQEKATLVPDHLKALLAKGDLPGAADAVAKLKNLLQTRLEAGITDRIQTMWNNYGFVGNRPIQIDVGRIRFDAALLEKKEEESQRITQNLDNWISDAYPQLIY